MSSKSYELKPLQWDTDYFGVSSARVNLHGIISEKGQEEILEFCSKYDFVTISNFDNINENNLWIGSKTDAFLTDVNIQFMKIVTSIPDCQDEKTYVVHCLSQNKQIAEIARKSFSFSRFFNDKMLPENQAKNIYLNWTENAFGRDGKYFVISEREGTAAGYILFSFDDDSSVIELIAVDEKYQGQRVGKALIQALESFAVDQGIKKIKVGTQVNNTSAAQFYNAMGFKYISCSSVYHLWRK